MLSVIDLWPVECLVNQIATYWLAVHCLLKETHGSSWQISERLAGPSWSISSAWSILCCIALWLDTSSLGWRPASFALQSLCWRDWFCINGQPLKNILHHVSSLPLQSTALFSPRPLMSQISDEIMPFYKCDQLSARFVFLVCFQWSFFLLPQIL